MNSQDLLRSFGMSQFLLQDEIQRLEEEFGFSFRNSSSEKAAQEDSYFMRFEASLRKDAAVMARHYEVFYCLENSIRDFISDVMEGTFGENWWEEQVDEEIKKEARQNEEREAGQGFAPRSERPLDYVSFGQLSNIIEKHWELFAGVLRNRNAAKRVMHNLNMLRGPIAHCSVLPDDEVERLRLTLRDWFRQME